MQTRNLETDRFSRTNPSDPSRVRADGGDAPLSVDEAFSVLANSTRRHVLDYLQRDGGPVDRRELARHVTARELDCDPDEVTAADVERTTTTLHHLALPSLREKGLVGYDDDAVWATRTDPTVDRLLDAVADDP
jgi:hypothetical protein